MSEAESRRRKVSEELRNRLCRKEKSRAAINKDISQLRALEKELERRLGELDRKREELEKRCNKEQTEREALLGRKTLLERELSELEGKLRGLGQAEGLYREGLKALRQQEEGILGEYETSLKILLKERETAPPEAEPQRREPPPKGIRPDPVREAPEAHLPGAEPTPGPPTGFKALQVRAPKGELCAAFLEGAQGLVVMEAEAYLNFLRRSLHHMNTLYKRYLSLRLESPQGASEATKREFEDIDRTKGFLLALTNAVCAGRLEAVRGAEGARVTSTLSRSEGPFEVEAGTAQVVNARVLDFLGKLLEKDVESFFKDEGPYHEICDYLNACQNFMEELGKERRAKALFKQLRREAPRRTPEPQRAPDKSALSGLIPREINEHEEVMDLGQLSLEPRDKASILSQEERALELSDTELHKRRPFDLNEAEASLAVEAPAINPEGNGGAVPGDGHLAE